MKKIIILAAAVLSFGAVNAQRIGVKAGLNFANVNSLELGDDSGVKQSALTTFHVGVKGDLNFTDELGVNASLLFTQKGVKFVSDNAQFDNGYLTYKTIIFNFTS